MPNEAGQMMESSLSEAERRFLEAFHLDPGFTPGPLLQDPSPVMSQVVRGQDTLEEERRQPTPTYGVIRAWNGELDEFAVMHTVVREFRERRVTTESIERLFDKPQKNALYFVALADEVPARLVAVAAALPLVPPQVSVAAVVVHPEYRNRGIGHALYGMWSRQAPFPFYYHIGATNVPSIRAALKAGHAVVRADTRWPDESPAEVGHVSTRTQRRPTSRLTMLVMPEIVQMHAPTMLETLVTTHGFLKKLHRGNEIDWRGAVQAILSTLHKELGEVLRNP